MHDHPFPKHIVEAVAGKLARQRFIQAPFSDLSAHDKGSLINDTNALLQALWDASRVDTWEQLEQVQPFAVVLADRHVTPTTARGLLGGGRLDHDLPVRVLHWGYPNG